MKKMSSENLNYLLIGILATLLLVGIVAFIIWNMSQSSSKAKKEKEPEVAIPSSSPVGSPSPTMEEEIPSPIVTQAPTSLPEQTPTVVPPTQNPTVPPEVGNTEGELGVIQYFEQGLNDIESTPSEEVPFRERAKDTFTSIVDFIFYEKEIGGYRLKDLTNSAKLKVISLALKMDHSIDQHFPNYKETVKDKYASFKGKIAVKYLEVTQSLCEKVGEDTCNQAKEDFEAMKNSFGFTWSLLKELATAGKEKISNFYLNWRNS